MRPIPYLLSASVLMLLVACQGVSGLDTFLFGHGASSAGAGAAGGQGVSGAGGEVSCGAQSCVPGEQCVQTSCCSYGGAYLVYPVKGGYEASSARLFDTDGEGRLEAVWTNQLGEDIWITALDEHGSPDIDQAQIIHVGRGVNVPAFGDVDSDGRIDLLVARKETIGGAPINEILVYRGLAGGGFEGPDVVEQEGKPRVPVLLDYNGDGALDIMLRTDNCNGVRWGIGDGSFGAFFCQVDLGGAFVARVRGGYHEKREQLLTIRDGDIYLYGLQVRENLGEFPNEQRLDIGSVKVDSAGVADLNDDGIDDVLVFSHDDGERPNEVLSYLRDANNELTLCDSAAAPPDLQGVHGTGGVERAFLGDFDHDGVADLVAIDIHDESQSVGSSDYYISRYLVMRGWR